MDLDSDVQIYSKLKDRLMLDIIQCLDLQSKSATLHLKNIVH